MNRDMAPRLPDYRTLASLSRINLLHELQQHGAKTVTELADSTGLHHNTAREHLHRLIEAGFVDSESIPSVGRGRPQLLYRAARNRQDPVRQRRQESSENRTALLRRLLPVREVTGEDEARTRQLDSLDDHMEQCGFDAEINAGGTHMTMFGCPFAGLAHDNPQVCEVHFNLVQDALAIDDGPMRATELHPFCGPDTCTVDLHDSDADQAS